MTDDPKDTLPSDTDGAQNEVEGSTSELEAGSEKTGTESAGKKPRRKSKPKKRTRKADRDAKITQMSQSFSIDKEQLIAALNKAKHTMTGSETDPPGDTPIDPEKLMEALPDFLANMITQFGAAMKETVEAMSAPITLGPNGIVKAKVAKVETPDEPAQSDDEAEDDEEPEAPLLHLVKDSDEGKDEVKGPEAEVTAGQTATDSQGDGEPAPESKAPPAEEKPLTSHELHVGRNLRRTLDDYVMENIATDKTAENVEVKVDAEFLKKHAGSLLANLLGTAVKAFIPKLVEEGVAAAHDGAAENGDQEAKEEAGEKPNTVVIEEVDPVDPSAESKVSFKLDVGNLFKSLVRKVAAQAADFKKAADAEQSAAGPEQPSPAAQASEETVVNSAASEETPSSDEPD